MKTKRYYKKKMIFQIILFGAGLMYFFSDYFVIQINSEAKVGACSTRNTQLYIIKSILFICFSIYIGVLINLFFKKKIFSQGIYLLLTKVATIFITGIYIVIIRGALFELQFNFIQNVVLISLIMIILVVKEQQSKGSESIKGVRVIDFQSKGSE